MLPFDCILGNKKWIQIEPLHAAMMPMILRSDRVFVQLGNQFKLRFQKQNKIHITINMLRPGSCNVMLAELNLLKRQKPVCGCGNIL